ncbi:MAG: hypothetical protein ACYDCK_07120, partial [Thermoplasmatota archaeon]
ASRAARVLGVRKLVCVNVVWTLGEARPFERRDDRMALELALSRPVSGAREWADILAANEGLLALVPQIPRVREDDASLAPPSRFGRAFARLVRSPHRRAILDAVAWRMARALHAVVRLSRWRRPALRERVARLEATKRPYDILARPRRPVA